MRIMPILILLLVISASYAQVGSSGYKIQREKVSALLAKRNERFNEYQNSLNKRSGVFGAKTKKDIQRSVDILTEIVKTDNAILEETEKLLSYKEQEKTQIETKVSDVEARISGYTKATANLQKQNSLLSLKMAALQKQKDNYAYAILMAGILMTVLLIAGIKRVR